MGEVKMSDVFKGELRREVGSLEVWEDSLLGGGDFVAEFEVLSQLEYSVNAINSYDANQKLITKQAARINGQLKMIEVAGSRIHGLESEVDKQGADIKLLREHMQRIVMWNELTVGERIDMGSNGQIRYYQDIAIQALAATNSDKS